MLKKINVWLFVWIVFVGAACQKSIPPSIPVGAKTIANVKYGTDSLQNMDVYLPANRTTASTNVLIMIHGGSWQYLDKTDLDPYVKIMQEKLPTYAIFNINYTLATMAKPSTAFPTQENDVKLAVNFIKSKSADYLIGDKYVLFGTSAGAHLALLQGYKYTDPVAAKAIVDFFGPTDMKEMYTNPAHPSQTPGIFALMGGRTPSSDSAFYANSSPITFVKPTSAPTIILHGGADVVVRVQQSIALKDKLAANGVAHQYVYYPAGGHGGWNDSTTTDAFNKIQAFILQHVK